MNSSVSVFVPCYGYGHLVKQCVDSVLGQTGVDVRVLVIDDASSDDTPAVAAALVKSDSRVEYRRHDVNKGHIATFNEGLEWATGTYTILLSADDVLVDGALQRAVTALDANPDASFCYGRALLWNDGEPRPEPTGITEGDPYRIVAGPEWIEYLCRKGDNMVYSPEVVSRTTCQQIVGGYRADLPHTGDMQMWLRLATVGDVVVLNADQAFYRIHADNMHGPIKRSIFDLEQRRDAFLSVLDENSASIDNSRHLRTVARRSIVRNELEGAIQDIDQGGRRTAVLPRLGRVLRFDPLNTLTTWKAIPCLARLVVGGRSYQTLRLGVARVGTGR